MERRSCCHSSHFLGLVVGESRYKLAMGTDVSLSDEIFRDITRTSADLAIVSTASSTDRSRRLGWVWRYFSTSFWTCSERRCESKIFLMSSMLSVVKPSNDPMCSGMEKSVG